MKIDGMSVCSMSLLNTGLPPVFCWVQGFSGKESAGNTGDIPETKVRSLGQEDSLEKEMVTHSSILAWEILWTEEHGGCRPGGRKRVGDDLVTKLLNIAVTLWLEQSWKSHLEVFSQMAKVKIDVSNGRTFKAFLVSRIQILMAI